MAWRVEEDASAASPESDVLQELGRLPSGRIEAPDRYVRYDGQVIVRTRYSTHQQWITEGWDHRHCEDLPYILGKRYCTGDPRTLKPTNPHLEDDQIEVYYVEDSEMVYYDVFG